MTTIVTKVVHFYEQPRQLTRLYKLFGMDLDEAYDLADREHFVLRLKRLWPGSLIWKKEEHLDDGRDLVEAIAAGGQIIGVRNGAKWIGMPEFTELDVSEIPTYRELSRRLDLWFGFQNPASFSHDKQLAETPPPFPVKPIEFHGGIFGVAISK